VFVCACAFVVLSSQEPSTSLYPEPDESSTCFHPIFPLSITFLSSQPRLLLSSNLFALYFYNKTLYAILSHACCSSCPYHPFLHDHSNHILRGVQVMGVFVMQFSPASCYFIPLSSKYCPQRLVLEHPQSTQKVPNQ
jgi:hypothetical protein